MDFYKDIEPLLNKKDILSAEEEQIVFRYYKEHPSIELRNRIAEKNFNLVHKLSSRYVSATVPTEDLDQEGMFGLMIAIDRFDYTKGYKFSTYACHWIHQAIGRYLMNNGKVIRIPIHMQEDYRKINKVIEKYKTECWEEPEVDWIAEETGLPREKVENVLNYFAISNTVSLNHVIGDDDDGAELEDFIPDDYAGHFTEQTNFDIDMQDLLGIMKRFLNEREYRIIVLRFGLEGNGSGKTLEEVGKEFNITREGVRQIERKAIRKLQRPSCIALLKDFRFYLCDD